METEFCDSLKGNHGVQSIYHFDFFHSFIHQVFFSPSTLCRSGAVLSAGVIKSNGTT